MEDALKLIKETILNTARKYNIEIDKIILFGSRARGGYREDSDYDLLVITKQRLDRRVRDEFILEIVRALARKGIDAHPIVVSKEGYEARKKYVGAIEGFASIEGKTINGN